MREANFDGLVGPTHNFAGLARGNLASLGNEGSVSQPRQAALQGLAKMKRLMDVGLPQGVLPPPLRPHLPLLRRIGFSGTPAQQLNDAARQAPAMLARAYSASAMWAANAATVTPSCDSADGHVHLTVANLCTHLHRSLEPAFTHASLARIFADERFFSLHPPLPAHAAFADEGAANHMRLQPANDTQGAGLNVFVYGRDDAAETSTPRAFPARQTRTSGEAIVRLHGLQPGRQLFLQQNPVAIDQGVFHNDVIAVAHGHALLLHEDAFIDTAAALQHIDGLLGGGWQPWLVRRQELSVEQSVRSYLFNSQWVTLDDGKRLLLAPQECAESAAAQAVIERLQQAGAWQAVEYVELRQSMRNGGGPACLRLRVPLTEREQAAVHPGCWLTDTLYDQLCAWVARHYRDRLAPDDLRDPQLLQESQTALSELETLLGLPGLYDEAAAALTVTGS